MTTPGATEAVTPEHDFTSVLARMEEQLKAHPWWKKRCDGTPLDNDTPVQAAVVALDMIREAEANALRRAAEWKATHRHYKGGLYRVIGEAIHTETSAFLTIYDNEEGNIFARPQGMFYGTIEDGSPRFRSLLPKEEGK